MGSASGYLCRTCGTRFRVRSGGGFYFDLLHCDTCGKAKNIGHQELGEIHLRFVKGLPGPYAVARSAMDRRIQREYAGEPLTRDEYGAQARCPACRSTSKLWDRDPKAPGRFYD